LLSPTKKVEHDPLNQFSFDQKLSTNLLEEKSLDEWGEVNKYNKLVSLVEEHKQKE